MLTRPEWLLRIESIAAAALAVGVYQHLGKSWLIFAILVLVPDLSMLGYLSGSAKGAAAYNAVHTAVVPFVLAAVGMLTGNDWPTAIAVIWLAHIAVDRALGFGLKRPASFKDTHLAEKSDS